MNKRREIVVIVTYNDLWIIVDAKAEPRKMGEWVQNVFRTDIHRYECSNCKAHHGARYDFCPTCGARMERSSER